MKKLFLLAGFAITLISTSCKKDKGDNTPDPGTGGNGSKLLKKLTDKEGNVTTIYNLTYDNNKRLTSITSADNKESTVFTYDGNGNLLKLEEKQEGYHSIYSFTYTNGVPVSGTVKGFEVHDGGQEDIMQDDELTYTIANEQVSNIHVTMKLVAQEIDFKMTYQNGNLTKIETPGTNMYTATFTYGTKKPMLPVVTKWILDQGFALQFAAKHEVLSMTLDFPGTESDQNVITDYTYDGNGYVLTSNNGTNQITFDYQ